MAPASRHPCTALVVVALGALLAAPAWAGDDDDLAPLTPVKPKPKPAAPPRPKVVTPARKPTPAPPAPAHARPDDDLAPLTPVAARGELVVRVAGGVQGAVLLVDGKEVAPLPAPRQTLPAGEHLVAVRRPGFATFTRKVTVSPGRAAEVEVRLVATAAVLTVRTDVTDALVTVNGKPMGLTPLLELEVPPGPVDLVVSRDGYLDERQRLVVAAGRDYPVVLRLSPSPTAPPAADAPLDRALTPTAQAPGPMGVSEVGDATPLTQRWYFWVGVAAVVVAAAVGTVAGVTAAQPPRQLTPAEICGPTGCAGCIGLSCTP